MSVEAVVLLGKINKYRIGNAAELAAFWATVIMLEPVLYSSFSLWLLCNLARSLIKTPDKVEENETEVETVRLPWQSLRERGKSQTMKTFACCSLAGFPSYVFGFFRFFRFSLIRHTHCCRHWRVLSLSFTGSKLCGNSFESRGIVKELKGFPAGFGWVATGAGIEVGAECLTRRPLKSCSSSGLMQKCAGWKEESAKST